LLCRWRGYGRSEDAIDCEAGYCCESGEDSPAMTEQNPPNSGELLLYETEDSHVRVECRLAQDSLWLSQGLMADLFQTSKQNIARHLKAIFAEGELRQEAVVNQLQWLTTAADGKSYRVAYYNLDAILAVGCRVRSVRGVQFRRWASECLSEYLRKGFMIDDERLKNPPIDIRAARIISMNCWSASGISAPASATCTCACVKFLPWLPIITIPP
jgi:hypothetical protein